jgi:hypothetical protein
MPQIECNENRVLKLVNVLSRKVPESEFFSQEKQVIMLQNWIKAKGYETQGPLILYSSGVKGIDSDKKPIIDSRLMLQLKQDKVRLEIPYKFQNEIRIENCLMVRFNGDAEKLSFATGKLTLFAYENDIELTGEMYMIFLKQEGNILLVDVFAPIKSNENSAT